MLIIGVLCFVVSIIAIYIAVDPPHGDPDVWLWRAILIAIASAELGSFWLMFRCCRSGAFPLRRLPQSQVWIPLLLRPIVAGWWLVHFAGLAVGIHFFLPTFFGGNNVRPALALHLLGLVWLVFLEFSSNAYLILGVGALTRNQAINRCAYNLRLVIDLLIAIVVWLLPIGTALH